MLIPVSNRLSDVRKYAQFLANLHRQTRYIVRLAEGSPGRNRFGEFYGGVTPIELAEWKADGAEEIERVEPVRK
jgi:hypothetical protein